MLTAHVQDDLLLVRLAGKVSKEEYDGFEVQLKKVSEEHDHFRVYADCVGMDGAEIGAIWEDLKNIPYYRNIIKFAVIGDKKWQEIAAKLSTIFIKGEVKYFSPEQKEEAKEWIRD